jgi:hypothetical protein
MDLEKFDSQLKFVGNLYDRWRKLANGAIGLQHLKQTHLSRAMGIPNTNLNQFLNGKLNLLPQQIRTLFEEIGIQDCGLLRTPINFSRQPPVCKNLEETKPEGEPTD